MDTVTLECISADTYRITKNGEAVAVAVRLSDHVWGAFDLGEKKRLTTLTFPRPQDVFNWWKAYSA